MIGSNTTFYLKVEIIQVYLSVINSGETCLLEKLKNNSNESEAGMRERCPYLLRSRGECQGRVGCGRKRKGCCHVDKSY